MEDTIAAVATAPGEGGIGIVRISGEKAGDILNSLFFPKKKKDREGITNRKMIYGEIRDPKSGRMIDEVLAVFMEGPHTYTAEDVAEIHCHGGIVSLQKVLSLTMERGARLAQPGEFTKRAFLNGRMDLTQAEGVIDLIKAKTEKTFDLALSQMEGGLFRKISEIRALLMDLLVKIAVNLDYPEEDIPELSYCEQEKSLSLIDDKLEKLLSTADTGRMLREGIAIAIIGKPNVGKSSLMNVFLQESRAIVTDIPGTTRDIIEEALSIRGIPVRLTDTAGIRQTDNLIERIGIEKTREAFSRSDLVILMVEGNSPLSLEDREIMEQLEGRETVVLLNKQDLGSLVREEDIKALLPQARIILTSMIWEKGMEELKDCIEELVYGGRVYQEESLLVGNLRHLELLKQGAAALKDAMDMTARREALDFIEVDIRQAWEALGEIIGQTASETIIDQVFSRFCLGK